MADHSLDPKDWDAFRAEARALLDDCIDQMQAAGERPWTHVPDGLEARYAIGQGGDVMQRLRDDVMPYHAGNTHPKYWGWVQGSGLATDVMAGMVTAVMNSNCGGRNHGANYMERAVIDWARQQMGMPEGASGVLVTGTSQATVISFAAARLRALGPEVRAVGQGGAELTCYAGQGVHNATRKALELLGIGAANLRFVPLVDGQMDCAELRKMIAEDRAAGKTPFLVVGTAGSVDLGLFDDFNALADLVADEKLWLHVDGAFGAWTRLADAPYRQLTDGIGRADSIALDFHKWMYVGYDCGLALIRDEAEHRAAFAARPVYLSGKDRGVASGDPWYCDYGIDLSRGNRALKVWLGLETHGAEAFGAAITFNCELARFMAEVVESHENMAVARQPVSNVCVFTLRADLPEVAQSALNTQVAVELQENGEAVFSTTIVDGVEMLRAAIVNHRSTRDDVREAVAAAARAAEAISAR
ncbi:pyridoxal-dependent decarboxylase [Cognatishimia sp. SS12]|uniref:pyridoxal phosphate-dependent decarboxylase family protein n=1 Tax=Cognatishimia sp. SS12 TaxID=2979465 RepID=UPI0023300BD0|nr:pyridoxal-dependent decarboxylase [Cognatishimia sp. SS12]MDC0736757.1 pyridoxal-dependent decarboxylase [Cognatishimia sp. SS12]